MLQLTFNPGLTPGRQDLKPSAAPYTQNMGKVPPGSLAPLFDQNLRFSVPIYDPTQNLIL